MQSEQWHLNNFNKLSGDHEQGRMQTMSNESSHWLMVAAMETLATLKR
jgi:hypothetical protein